MKAWCIRVPVLLLALLLAVSATGVAEEKPEKPKRGPSTAEERTKAIEIAHRLEGDPLGKDAKDLRAAMIGWLAEVPDLKVTVCDLIPELLKTKKNFAAELFTQSVVSAGAFVAEEPDLSSDFLLVNTAAVEGTLKAYESILKIHPDAKWPVLDGLLAKRSTGELPDFVREAAVRCGEEIRSEELAGNKKTDRANEFLHTGNRFYDRGEYQAALIEYRRLVALFPEESSGYHELSQTFYALKNFDKAVENANHAIQLNPKCWLCYQALGSIYDDSGKPDEALTNFQKAIDLVPNSGRPLYNKAVTLQRLKRAPEAIVDLQKAIEVDPGYASPHRLLASLLSQRGDTYLAETQYKEFLKLEPRGDRADAVHKLLTPGVHVDGEKLKKEDPAFDAYVKYSMVRADWIVSGYRKKNPTATSYKFTADEELAAVGGETAHWQEIRKANPKARDTQLDRLSKIADAGFLEPFVYSYWSSTTEGEQWKSAHQELVATFHQWAAAQTVSLEPIKQPTHVEWVGASF